MSPSSQDILLDHFPTKLNPRLGILKSLLWDYLRCRWRGGVRDRRRAEGSSWKGSQRYRSPVTLGKLTRSSLMGFTKERRWYTDHLAKPPLRNGRSIDQHTVSILPYSPNLPYSAILSYTPLSCLTSHPSLLPYSSLYFPVLPCAHSSTLS